MPAISDPPSYPSAWLCKFYYWAYRWIIFYCFHTPLRTNCTSSYLAVHKNLTPHTIIASHYFKNHHFLFAVNQLLPHMLRISYTSHQNHHILLARTNHHCSLALYFCTTLQDWVLSFSDFYYEHHYIPFMSFSEITIYLIRFLHHIQASYVITRHTDFSQNKTVYLLK